MTTEEFYAHALLAALPIAAEKSLSKLILVKRAHEYAALLTETFTANRGTYAEEAGK